MMTVRDLNRHQLNELKESYACQLRQDGISWGELCEAHKIPDDIIFEHYDGVTFVEEDFGYHTEEY
jgi:hypothetical protein